MPGNDIAGLTDKITWSAERFKAGVESEQEFRANVANLLNALETDQLKKAGYRESKLQSKIDALEYRAEQQKKARARKLKPAASDNTRLRSFADAVREIGISDVTLRRKAKANVIRTVRIGRRVLIPQSELERICRDGIPQDSETEF